MLDALDAPFPVARACAIAWCVRLRRHLGRAHYERGHSSRWRCPPYLSILPSQTRQQGARRASVPPCEQSMRTFRTSIVLLACSLSAVLAGTNAFGKKFLEENTARAGVTTLPSGLQYKVLRDGDGVPRQPTAVSLRGARGNPHPSPNTAQVRDTRCPTRAANATTRAARRRSGARHPRGRSSTARTTAAARPRLRRAASWQAGRRRCS